MNIKTVIATLPQIGKLTWIGVRRDKGDLEVLTTTQVSVETGLQGDRYSQKGKRQVTLIQAEHLAAVGSMLGQKTGIDPNLVRRNLVVTGINLMAFKNRQFQIGTEVILEMTGLCHPCTKMERNLGAGGYNAMRGHGGITARVIHGGQINVGDRVELVAIDKN